MLLIITEVSNIRITNYASIMWIMGKLPSFSTNQTAEKKMEQLKRN